MKGYLSQEVQVHSQFAALSSADPVESGESLRDFMTELIRIQDAPRNSGESDADYAARKEADRQAVYLAASSNLMGGVRYLIIGILRHLMETGAAMSATVAQDSQCKTPEGALDQIMEATGLTSHLGPAQRSNLKGYFKWVIPALQQHGYELTDELVMMFVDESGDLGVPDVAKEAKRLVMSKGGVISEDEAKAIYNGIVTGKTSEMNKSMRFDQPEKIEIQVDVVDGGYAIKTIISEVDWKILEARLKKEVEFRYY